MNFLSQFPGLACTNFMSWIYIYEVGNFCAFNLHCFGKPRIIFNSKNIPNYGILSKQAVHGNQ